MKITITADRKIDLPAEKLKELDIPTMSCFVNMGGNSYQDMIDITPDEVFEHYNRTGELAKTAARNPDDYYEFFEPFTGKDKAVIHFSVSSGISMLYENAVKASERLPNIYVIDTRTLSNGIALLVEFAKDLIKNGENDSKKIYELCVKKREKLQESFIISTLEYLHKGGRCSALKYYAANLLRIKPVVMMSKVNGKMLVREKCKGNIRHAIANYVDNTFKKFPNPDLKHIYISCYSKDAELIEYFTNLVNSYHTFEKVSTGHGSCNSTIHSGPNSFGIFYFVK